MSSDTDDPGETGHTLPDPPYYAVIFTSERTDRDDGYAETARRMLALAAQQPGFLGVESARDDALGITVSYWKDLAAIEAWRQDAEHLEAQRLGRKQWYRRYRLRIARVEQVRTFDADGAGQ